jgi:uncharacterized protein
VTSFYNIAMLAVDVAAIVLLGRLRSLAAWGDIMACWGIVAATLAAVLGGGFENHFGVIRLAVYGVFLHGPVMLIASAVLWRRSRRWLACAAALAVLALMAVAVDAFLIEPTCLEVSYWRITSAKIHKPLRIVVLADLQTDQFGPFERQVLQQMLDEQADIVLFAGDYIHSSWQQQESLREQFRSILREPAFRQLASKKLFAVRGNTDPADWTRLFEGIDLDVTAVDATRSFDLGEIRLTCLGVADSFNTSLAVANESPGRFHLVLGHAPNFARGLIDADLLVAGHTHGGQVRLPGIGPLITFSRVPRAWAAGLTELGGGRTLLVSRGIGMERGYAPRMRFLCHPELMVIDLVPEATRSADAGN